MKLVSLTAIVALVALAGGALWFMSATDAAAPQAPPEFADVPAATDAPHRKQRPQDVFGHTCGACHTLAAAGATGLFGPNLDEARPSAARVRRMIRTGSLDGLMRPRLLRGREARAMAAYVARVAGS